MEPNTDALAEAHWAKEDPQNSDIDDDLIAWEERRTEEELRKFKDVVIDIIETFEPENQTRLANNAEYLGEWLTEYLEEEI